MDVSPSNLPLNELYRKLADVRSQAAKLEEEIAWLETRGQMVLPPASTTANPSVPQSPAEKIALFLDLFGRVHLWPKSTRESHGPYPLFVANGARKTRQ
jgi:hypothetical protein